VEGVRNNVIHLALTVAAFLFLCWVAFWVVAIAWSILCAIFEPLMDAILAPVQALFDGLFEKKPKIYSVLKAIGKGIRGVSMTLRFQNRRNG